MSKRKRKTTGTAKFLSPLSRLQGLKHAALNPLEMPRTPQEHQLQLQIIRRAAEESIAKELTSAYEALFEVGRRTDEFNIFSLFLAARAEKDAVRELIRKTELDTKLSAAWTRFTRIFSEDEHPELSSLSAMIGDMIKAIHAFLGEGEYDPGDNGQQIIETASRYPEIRQANDIIKNTLTKRGAKKKLNREYIAGEAFALEDNGYSLAEQVIELLRRLHKDPLSADERSALEEFEKSGIKKGNQEGKTRGQIDYEINETRKQYIRNCKRDFPRSQ